MSGQPKGCLEIGRLIEKSGGALGLRRFALARNVLCGFLFQDGSGRSGKTVGDFWVHDARQSFAAQCKLASMFFSEA
jgi:hypothetical protein